MKAFIEILREKYGLAQPEAEKLLEQMELLTYRKGEHIVREGERNSSFYLVADGIWRGHYLRDGVDISLWFAFQGDSIFSSWGYVAGLPSLVSIEAMSEAVSIVFLKASWRLFSLLPSCSPTSEESSLNASFWTWKTG